MAKKQTKNSSAKPAAKVLDITAKLAQALGAKPAAPAAPKAETKPTDTGLGPNAQFPFGIKIADDKGNISYERFKTAAERDKRAAVVKGSKRVDFILDQPAAQPAAKPADPGKPAAPAASKPAKADPKPASKPAAKPADKPKGDGFALHLNKTGRLCFGKDAAARLGDKWRDKPMSMAIEKGIVRIDIAPKASDDTLPIRDGSGRPYISATKQFKPLGFDGADSRDITAKPWGKAGFEFRLA